MIVCVLAMIQFETAPEGCRTAICSLPPKRSESISGHWRSFSRRRIFKAAHKTGSPISDALQWFLLWRFSYSENSPSFEDSPQIPLVGYRNKPVTVYKPDASVENICTAFSNKKNWHRTTALQHKLASNCIRANIFVRSQNGHSFSRQMCCTLLAVSLRSGRTAGWMNVCVSWFWAV